MAMNNTTGKHIEGVAWLKQRLTDVMTTPLGTRVMRRGYGSELFDLIDQPMTARWLVQVYAATAKAVANPINGLPDFKLMRVNATRNVDGQADIDMWGVYVPTGELLKIEGIRI